MLAGFLNFSCCSIQIDAADGFTSMPGCLQQILSVIKFGKHRHPAGYAFCCLELSTGLLGALRPEVKIEVRRIA